MFSKKEQRTWIKIVCARGRTAKQCHRGLQEACDAAALPYRTVARWVAAFRDGRERVEHMPRSGHPPVSDENVQLVSALVEVDRNVTIRQLEQDTALAHSTVFHILKDLLKMRKIASKWVPHDLTDMHKWQRYDASRMHLQCYEREGEAFLWHFIAIDETWAKSYEPELNPHGYTAHRSA